MKNTKEEFMNILGSSGWSYYYEYNANKVKNIFKTSDINIILGQKVCVMVMDKHNEFKPENSIRGKTGALTAILLNNKIKVLVSFNNSNTLREELLMG